MKKRKLKNITEEQNRACKKFSEDCFNTNATEYKNRNQGNQSKVKQDIYYGKVAEFMVYNYLKKEGKKCSLPDLKIYNKEKKSFDSDLQVDSEHIHVKSCLGNSGFPNSWLFQPYDPLVKKPTNSDHLALCVIDKESYFYLVSPKKIKYEKPLKKSLDKKVIYEKNLDNIK